MTTERNRHNAMKRRMKYGVNKSTLQRKRRKALIKLYGRVCFWCGKQDLQPGDLTVDHVLDSSRGGSTELYNLRIACHECNRRRANASQKLPREHGHPKFVGTGIFTPEQVDAIMNQLLK